MTDDQKPPARRRGGRAGRLVAVGTDAESSPGAAATSSPRRVRNSQTDRDFIQQAAEKGELRVTDGRLQWSGRSEDMLHPYQVAPDERRCEHAKLVRDDDGNGILDTDGELLRIRCPKWAMLNAGLCVEHAQGSKAVMSAAREMIAGAALALTGQLIKEALEAPQAADRIKAINSLLDRFGIRAGIEVGPDMPAWREIMDELGKDTGVTE